MGQQRFTYMEARVTVFLQDMDIPALFGQQGGNGRTGRASSHDEDVTDDKRLSRFSGHGSGHA